MCSSEFEQFDLHTFGLLMDAMPEPILLLGQDLCVRAANQVARVQFAVEGELAGASVEEFVVTSRERFVDWLQQCGQLPDVSPGRWEIATNHGLRTYLVEGTALRLKGNASSLLLLRFFEEEPLNQGLNELNRQIDALNKEIARRRQVEKRLKESQRRLQEANAQLQWYATTDGLTNLTNRRAFDSVFMRAWQQALAEGFPVAAILLDIDHFKLYNDRYGHLAGDRCLQQVARAIRDQVDRASHIVARYGGEEFVVVLLRTDLQRSVETVVSIFGAVQALRIPHEIHPSERWITLSAGVALATPHAGMAAHQLLIRADQALYAAKERGRNQFVVAPQGTFHELNESPRWRRRGIRRDEFDES